MAKEISIAMYTDLNTMDTKIVIYGDSDTDIKYSVIFNGSNGRYKNINLIVLLNTLLHKAGIDMKTTKKHFEIFKEECLKWQRELGLMNYTIYIKHKNYLINHERYMFRTTI